MSKQQNVKDKLMSECTGAMRVDEDGNYLGYYTRWQLMHELLRQGHDRQAVDIYIFCGLRECTEWHPKPEDFAEMQEQSVAIEMTGSDYRKVM